MTAVRNVFSIANRELRAYFATPVGWMAIMGYLFVTGFMFLAIFVMYAMEAANMGMNPYGPPELNVDEWLVAPFFSNISVILLFMAPALTMRLFADDRKSRSLELLLTSPVSTLEIVLGKYLGAIGFMVVLLLCSTHYAGILFWLGDPDPGILMSSYLSVLLLAACFMAVGLMTSAFTESQIVAVLLSFGMLLIFWLLGWAEESIQAEMVKEVLGFASLVNRTQDMTKGLVHTQDLVYFTTFAGFFLFVTHQRVEAYRWR